MTLATNLPQDDLDWPVLPPSDDAPRATLDLETELTNPYLTDPANFWPTPTAPKTRNEDH